MKHTGMPARWRVWVGICLFVSMLWSVLSAAEELPTPTPISAPVLDIPYRANPLVLDANADEWRNGAVFVFSENRGQPAARNVVQGKIAWDADALWIYAEIADRERIAAPAGLTPEQFHLFDLVQVYLDPIGDSAERMNLDDVNILLLPDGRAASLRGDTLLTDMFDATVPQRVGAPLSVNYQTQITEKGWQFELRIPFVALGVPSPAIGAQAAPMRMDIAMQDWRVDSRTLDAGTMPTSEQLLSISWLQQIDFGYPARWRQISLTGRAPLLERGLARLGPLGVGALLFLFSSWVGLILLRRQAKRFTARQRELQKLIQALQSKLAHSHSLEPASQAELQPDPDAREDAKQDQPLAQTSSEHPVDPRDQALVQRVLEYIQSDLQADHSVELLAQRFNMSVRTLQRRIKSGSGAAPNELVLATRLQTARQMILSGRHRISEVACAVGINDLTYFSRCYRRSFGHAPSQDASGANPS